MGGVALEEAPVPEVNVPDVIHQPARRETKTCLISQHIVTYHVIETPYYTYTYETPIPKLIFRQPRS